MRKYLIPLIFTSQACATTFDTVVDYIDETLDVSLTADKHGEYYATLNVSHNFNNSWRFFGEYTTNNYYEIGLGYSFSVFELYNEVSVKAVDSVLEHPKPYVGLFTAGLLYDFVWFTNFELGYGSGDLVLFKDDTPIVEADYHGYSFNKSVGLVYELTDWLDITGSYNHDTGRYETNFLKQRNFKDVTRYTEFGIVLNIKGVKPSITYTFGELEYLEFGLSFDF